MRAGTKRILIIGGAVVVVGAIIVANLKQKSAGKGTEVRTEAVGMRRIESWVRAPGKVQPVSKVQVSSNVMGRVVELAVREGQQVKSGDLLLRLDDERYRSQVQQYRATILSAEASRTLAEAQAREAKQNRDRKESLSTQGLASTQELEAARTADEVAAARAASAAEDVRRAKAALAEAEKNLRETVFIAPMDGTVTALNVEVGENVLTGTMNNPGTVILTLSDLASMEVLADVDETDVVNVASSQRARVLVDAIPDTAFEGSVTRVGQSGRGLTGQSQEATNFEVAVLLKSPPSTLPSRDERGRGDPDRPARQHPRGSAPGADRTAAERGRAVESQARRHEARRCRYDGSGCPQPRRGGLHRRRGKGEVHPRDHGAAG